MIYDYEDSQTGAATIALACSEQVHVSWRYKRGNDEARVNGVNGSAVVGRCLHYRGLSKSQLQLDSLY